MTQLERLAIADIVKIVPTRHGDDRGYFSEIFRDTWFREHVADVAFVQDNQSLSVEKGTIRGLHFQIAPFAQGKLVHCVRGAIFDVAVDIRKGAPTFGRWTGAELTGGNGVQLWIPAGFAHGFLTLEPATIVQYKVTAPYSAQHDYGLLWNDPEINIPWPTEDGNVVLSEKDRTQPPLAKLRPYFVSSPHMERA